MSTWKRQSEKSNFKNYWLQKSEEKRERREWSEKLEELAKMVTKFVRSGN